MSQSVAMNVFASNVNKVLSANGWTKARLAKMTAMSRPGITRILSGDENVTLPRAERIAIAIETPLSELLDPNFEIPANVT